MKTMDKKETPFVSFGERTEQPSNWQQREKDERLIQIVVEGIQNSGKLFQRYQKVILIISSIIRNQTPT